MSVTTYPGTAMGLPCDDHLKYTVRTSFVATSIFLFILVAFLLVTAFNRIRSAFHLQSFASCPR